MFVLYVGCALGRLAAVGRSYPEVAGDVEIAVEGPTGEVRITRDVDGIPHVAAGAEADAWWALGFVHAQDRLFQADLNRHLAWGELSLWFGEDTVDFDAFARALDLRGRAEAAYARQSEGTRAMLDAYARGMNAGAAARKVLPIEYRLLKSDFAPWQPEDALATLWLMSWNLQENLGLEMAAVQLRSVAPAALDAALASDPGPALDPYWDRLRAGEVGAWSAPFTAWTSVLGGAPAEAEASNAWVIGGERAEGGLPIVANDPHLVQGVPALWYAADLEGAPIHVAGATLPGVPGVVIGHSERVAWGLTNVMADQVDLAWLQRSGDGVRVEGRDEPLRRVRVQVPLPDGRTAEREVPFTSIGPVVSDPASPTVIALRWSALETDDHTADLLHDIARAGSVEELFAAGKRDPAIVAQNVVAGDVGGGYGWFTTGLPPKRRGFTGRVPYPGSEPEFGWDGLLDEHVEVRGSERGYLVTANSRPPGPIGDVLSTAYVPPHRKQRIEERIEAVAKHTPADEAAIQLDQREMLAAWNRDWLLEGVAPTTPQAQRCAEILRGWDLDAGRDSAGAAVWATFLDTWLRDVLTDDLGAADTEVVMSVIGTGRSPLNSGDGGSQDRFARAFVQDRATSVAVALETTCTTLQGQLGEDASLWTWGAIHPLQLRHPFTAQAPRLLGRWSVPDLPWYGSGATVAAAGYPLSGDVVKPVGGMASMRVVMPLADLGASTFVQPGGQSGQPLHPLSRSHLVYFATDQAAPLWFDAEDVAAHAADVLTVRSSPSR